MPLTIEQYQELSNYGVIERDKVITGEPLTKKQAKEHIIWIKLAHEDKTLLNEYVNLIFAKAKENYGFDKNMGIYLPNDQEIPALHA